MPNMAMAPMRRLVAIGRRMKISDRCTANLVSALPAPAAAATSLIAALPARIRAPITGLDASPGLEPQLSFGDDRLSGIQPLADDDVFVDPLTNRDGALLDGGVGLHHEHELPVLSGLHRLVRHDSRVIERRQVQQHPRELAWP